MMQDIPVLECCLIKAKLYWCFRKKKLKLFFFKKTVVSLTTKRKMSEDEEIALSQNHATIIKQNTPRELMYIENVWITESAMEHKKHITKENPSMFR